MERRNDYSSLITNNRILYQKISNLLYRVGSTSQTVSNSLGDSDYSTLIKAPEIVLPSTVKSGEIINVSIPADHFISAVDTKCLLYKINQLAVVEIEIPREIFIQNKVFNFSITIPKGYKVISLFYRTKDWIENYSLVRVSQAKVEDNNEPN